jgi:hypothetical protein
MVGPKLGTARSSLTLPSSSSPHKQSKPHRPGASRLLGQPLADSDLANGAEDISQLGSGKRSCHARLARKAREKRGAVARIPQRTPRAVPPAIALMVRADGRRSIRVAPLWHAACGTSAHEQQARNSARCWLYRQIELRLGKFMNRDLVQESRQSATV